MKKLLLMIAAISVAGIAHARNAETARIEAEISHLERQMHESTHKIGELKKQLVIENAKDHNERRNSEKRTLGERRAARSPRSEMSSERESAEETL